MKVTIAHATKSGTTEMVGANLQTPGILEHNAHACACAISEAFKQ